MDRNHTFFEALLEATQHLEKCKTDWAVRKEDVIQNMESRLSILIQKMAAHPTTTSFSLFAETPQDPQVT